MGILFIAVGFLFKVTAVPFWVATGWMAAYRLWGVGKVDAAGLTSLARAGLRPRETHQLPRPDLAQGS